MPACPACESSILETSRFCPSCGQSLIRSCPGCDAAVSIAARFCDACGTRLGPQPVTEPAADERKLVTILFADLVGSTTLGESLDPERLRAVLHTYFGAMSAVIESWGGTIEKFIGDAIMAVFGVPVVREDDAERAIHAALGMLTKLQDLNEDLRAKHGVSLQVRIGVNTGEVIAPSGGPADQMLVAGDAVNVAARLEQSAEPGSVRAGERTWLATRNAFAFDAPVQLDLQGKAQAVPGRRALGVLAEEPGRGVPGLRSSMVGRDHEMETLTRSLDDAIAAASPRLVAIFGTAGIGKSRLVAEFSRIAEVERGATLYRGRCLAVGGGTTYWALTEILRRACDISLDDPASVAVGKLSATIEELLPTGHRETLYALATMAGLAVPDNPLDRMKPGDVAEELEWAWPRFAGALAARAPTVLVIEDLHWAGPEVIEMIERIRMRAAGPLLVIGTSRPEAPHVSFAPRGDGAVFSLAPLTDAQSSALIEDLLSGAHDVPETLRTELLDRSEGNPFFLEELLRRLIDDGAIVREGERWRVSDVPHASLPDGVHALLAARIDALPAEEKRVLQEAAVVGRIFWEEPVADALALPSIGRTLLALERKDLVGARTSSTIAGQVEYGFKHALVRDVAYDGLSRSRRARAHAGVARWIEELAGGRTDEFAELLAYHWHSAVVAEHADLAWEGDADGLAAARQRAFRALMAAGAAARMRNAAAKAVELHQDALALAETAPDRIRVHRALGDDHAVWFRGDEAVAHYEAALALLGDDPEARPIRGEILGETARLYIGRGGTFRGKEGRSPQEIQRVLDAALRDTDDAAARARLLAYYAHASRLFAREEDDPVPFERRVRAAEEAWAIAERSDDVEVRADVAVALLSFYVHAGDAERAKMAVDRMRELLRDARSRGARCALLEELAAWASDVGCSFEEALLLADEYAALVAERSVHEQLHATSSRLRALFMLGRFSEMPSTIERHAELFQQEAERGCVYLRDGVRIGAIACLHLGSDDRAAELDAMLRPLKGPEWTTVVYLLARGQAGAAWDLAVDAPFPERVRRVGDFTVAYVEAAVANGRWEDVVGAIERSRPVAHTFIASEATLDRAEAKMLAASGALEESRASMRSALAGFERLGMRFEVARTRESLADLLPQDEARTERARALDAYERIGAVPHATRVRALL